MRKEQTEKKLRLNKQAVATLQQQSELVNGVEGRSIIWLPITLTASRTCAPETMAKDCVV
jgi:hypothetical protein